MNFALRMYRWLAHAFPHDFKLIYGTDVIQLGEDIVEDIARQNGVTGLFRLVADIAFRVPVEYLSEMRRDLFYAVRTLGKARGFAAVGLISLGLGISVAAVSVSETMNMILRDTPGARDPESLVMVNGVSYSYTEHFRDQHDLFSGVAAFQLAIPFNVSLGANSNTKAERVFGHLVSPEYFSVLGAGAARGRVFSPDVDKSGSAPVVFITDRFWRDRLDSDPSAIGRTIRVNGQTATIVGIGAKDFQGVMPFISADIFVPTTVPPAMAPELAGDVIHKRDAKAFSALLRLAPGVTLKSAEAGLDTLARHLDEETLDPARNAKGRRVTLLPGGKFLPIPREMLPMMLAFMVILDGLIVAIACMNLANMQLARATARRREVAIRISVGASRFRLIRQLLTESVLVALGGGATGILLAFWFANMMKKMTMPLPYPVHFDITPDWRAIAIVFAISLVAGVGFGLAPALAATKTDLATALKESSAGQMRGHRRFGMRNLLMVAQVGGSLTLLLVSGFLIIGYSRMNNIEIPFDSSTMLLLSIDPVRDGYSAEKATAFFDALPDRLRQAPGVRQAALTETTPFGPQAAASTLGSPADGTNPEQVVSGVAKNVVGANYFAALSIRMVEGREFDAHDQRIEASPSQALPAVINLTAAKAFFGTRDPIGRRISDAGKSYQVVGVVKDLSAPMSQSSVGEGASEFPVVYLPLTHADFAHPPGNGMIVMVRTDHGLDALEGVRQALSQIDPNLAVFNVKTLAEQVAETGASLRMGTFIYGGIGAFGLVLAAIGLAGVTAYSVARRRKELGIRIALGARRGQVLRLVMREGGAMVIIGSVLGLFGAVAISRVLAAFTTMLGPHFLEGARDPRLLIGAPLLLAGLAMLACYVPARRSTKIDPLIALREE
jgi:predicted permease